MIHETKAVYFDAVHPHAQAGRLIYDSAHNELHFYRQADGHEEFALSLDKSHRFELRAHGLEQHIEWRSKGNQSSALFVLNDQTFMRLVRDRYLAHKNIFWRFATYVWTESFVRVLLALGIALALTAIVGRYLLENAYHAVPVAWDKQIGEQAETGLKEFGSICSSPATVNRLKKFIPLFRDANSPHEYDIQILKSSIDNAFALPGGKITVFSATVANAKDYAELAGILAHEIGHVEHRHGMQQLSQYMALRLVLALAFGMTDDGAIVSLASDAGALLLLLKNSRDHERDADAFAARKLLDAGISNRAIRAFFARVNAEHEERTTQIPDFVLTHPADNERIRFFERYESKRLRQLRANQRHQDAALRALLAEKPALTADCTPQQENDDENY